MTLARRREAVEAGTIVDVLMHHLSLLFALNIVKLTLISEKISKGGRPPLEEAGAFLDNLPPQKLRKDWLSYGRSKLTLISRKKNHRTRCYEKAGRSQF